MIPANTRNHRGHFADEETKACGRPVTTSWSQAKQPEKVGQKLALYLQGPIHNLQSRAAFLVRPLAESSSVLLEAGILFGRKGVSKS